MPGAGVRVARFAKTPVCDSRAGGLMFEGGTLRPLTTGRVGMP